MEGWVGLRNVLVHLYSEVDLERLWSAIQDELDDFDEFQVALRKLLDRAG